VCGVTARQLRGEKLRDLVWRVVGRDGAVAGAQGATASVTLVYVPDDGEMDGVPGGTEVRFCRSISAAGTSAYRLDGGPEVSWDVYRGRLEEINVVTRAKNFLVFQVRRGGGGAGHARRGGVVSGHSLRHRSCRWPNNSHHRTPISHPPSLPVRTTPLSLSPNHPPSQGDVEQLASKDAKALLAHFETLCGSGLLK
jgi:hypothetical protein